MNANARLVRRLLFLASMCMCAWAHVCACAHAHMYARVREHAVTQVCVRTRVCMRECARRVRACTNARACAHVRSCARVRAFVRACARVGVRVRVGVWADMSLVVAKIAQAKHNKHSKRQFRSRNQNFNLFKDGTGTHYFIIAILVVAYCLYITSIHRQELPKGIDILLLDTHGLTNLSEMLRTRQIVQKRALIHRLWMGWGAKLTGRHVLVTAPIVEKVKRK
jgi:hypothetical protein